MGKNPLWFSVLFLLLFAFTGCQTDTASRERTDGRPAWMQVDKETMSQYQVDSVLSWTQAALLDKDRVQSWDSLVAELFLLRIEAALRAGAADQALIALDSMGQRALMARDTQRLLDGIDIINDARLSHEGILHLAPWIEVGLQYSRLQQRPAAETQLYRWLGLIRLRKNQLLDSQEAFLKAKDLALHHLDYSTLSRVSLALAENYRTINSLDAYYASLIEGLHYAELSGDVSNLLPCLNDLGVYYRKTLPDSALYCYDRIDTLLASSPGAMGATQVRNTYNRANTLKDKGDLGRAMRLYTEVYQKCEELGVAEGKALALSGLANVYTDLGQYDRALNQYRQGIQIADEIQYPKLRSEFVLLLRDLLVQVGDYQQALDLTEQENAKADSMASLERQLALHKMTLAFDRETKIWQNNQLREDIQLQEKIIRFRQLVLYLLILVVGGMIYFSVRTRRLLLQRQAAFGALMSAYQKEQLRNHVLPEDADAPAGGRERAFSRLMLHMINEKPYLDSRLKAETLIAVLGVRPSVFAAMLKEQGFGNFKQFVNTFRVDEAKKLLVDPDLQDVAIDDLYPRAGFGNKQTFYSTFEFTVGVTPGFFREQMRSRTEPEAPQAG